ncbi:ABC transporter permease [Sphingobium sp. BYY-5]|uniref:ABC transporter permease subunit n=1 Tax=Sphingobium sp. BYY-5 TaxID=2926400 RepID=UPI001FA79B5F|nr:ABC transporter permease subunit [Sphingobium sp. BYY-5]MCI4592521.1 ABC transporter permease [Sphingobium sp. BYY-5]
MTGMIRRLFAIEVMALVRQPLAVAVYAALFAAMLAAALVGAEQVKRTHAALATIATEQTEAISAAKSAAARYAKPSPLRIEYHRDPTDAFGYMNYFLVTHAVKPPLPLAGLATGQADLQPSHIRIDFNKIFPDTAFDLGNLHALDLGSFDLAFVLIYLVPLGLIAIGASRLTGEQDSGVLRMIAAQPVTLRRVALAKASALAIVSLVAIVGGMLLALLIAGSLGSLVILGVALLVAMWVLFWVALTLLAASFWRGTVGSVVMLVLGWAVLTVLAPTIAALAVRTALPAPSRIAYIDRSRAAMDAFYRDETAVHAAWLGRFPHDESRSTEMLKSPEVKRFARDAFYRDALKSDRETFVARDLAVAGATDWQRLMSPAMMLDGTLQAAAGNDVRHQLAFVAAADAYDERLRRWFEPLALTNAADPHRSCPDCPGRLNFTRYDDVPRFVPAPDHGAVMRAIGFGLLYLASVTALTIIWAVRRLHVWPA